MDLFWSCISIFNHPVNLFLIPLIAMVQIRKGIHQIPKWISPGARNMISRILDPNPKTRISIAEIKADEWFKQDYNPASPDDDEEDIYIDNEAFFMQEVVRNFLIRSFGVLFLISLLFFFFCACFTTVIFEQGIFLCR